MTTFLDVDFEVGASLMKWPTRSGQKVSQQTGSKPYTVVESTLGACIDRLLAKPENFRALYEIHTTPAGDVVPQIITAALAAELAKLRALKAEVDK
jgi:hypothetical protein